jgi:hypothetical protein
MAVGRIGEHVEGEGASQERGARAFGAAFLEVFRRSMSEPELPRERPVLPAELG